MGKLGREDDSYDAVGLIVPEWAAPGSTPMVTLRHDVVPRELSPARFFTIMVGTVLRNSPITMHTRARTLRDL